MLQCWLLLKAEGCGGEGTELLRPACGVLGKEGGLGDEKGGGGSALPVLGQPLSCPPCLWVVLHRLLRSWGCACVAPVGCQAQGSWQQQAGQGLGLGLAVWWV